MSSPAGAPSRCAAFVVRRGHSHIDGDVLSDAARSDCVWLNENGARVHLMTGQLPRLPPAPGGAVADALLPCVVLEFHTSRITCMATGVYRCRLFTIGSGNVYYTIPAATGRISRLAAWRAGRACYSQSILDDKEHRARSGANKGRATWPQTLLPPSSSSMAPVTAHAHGTASS